MGLSTGGNGVCSRRGRPLPGAIILVMKRPLLLSIALFMAGSHATTTGPSSQSNVAYPPSCLAFSVARDEPSGPTYSRSTSLAAFDEETMQPLGYEPVVFTFWRVACS